MDTELVPDSASRKKDEVMTKRYRDRIYGAYVSARQQTLAPSILAGLKPREPYLQNLVRRHFPAESDAIILDLGCGHGSLIYVARHLGYSSIWGVDGSTQQVAAAKLLGIEGVEHGSVMEALSRQPDASLDCLIAFDLIEHLDRDEMLALVDQARRVLRSGGRWIIHTPNAESPFASRMHYWDFTHEFILTRTSIAQLLLSSGFESVACFEDVPVVHGLKSAVRWILWKCIRSMLKLYIAVETGDASSGSIFSQNFLAVAIK
jgi:2-polyprenyl-3-methyl-5-hydroxy-6-metoxy-1,4-benzoquinol methylase